MNSTKTSIETKSLEISDSHDDRFIPRRNTPLSQDLFNIHQDDNILSKDIVDCSESEKDQLIFRSVLEQNFLGMHQSHNEINCFDNNHSFYDSRAKPKILNFGSPKENQSLINLPSNNLTCTDPVFNNSLVKFIKETRKISKIPYKVLDAPGVVDDFYKVI